MLGEIIATDRVLTGIIYLVERQVTSFEAGVRFPAGVISFSALPSVHTGPGTHSAPYTKGTGECFSMGKAAGMLS
jgi:hypothetical protein